jgi:prolyl-tRNA synthetase
MASAESLSQALSALSISPAARVSHGATTSDAEWRQALAGASGAPEKFALAKTLVFKPKTAKGAAPVPLVVVAAEATQTSAGALGKKMGLKELRLASEDVLQEFFALDRNSRACLHSSTPGRPTADTLASCPQCPRSPSTRTRSRVS